MSRCVLIFSLLWSNVLFAAPKAAGPPKGAPAAAPAAAAAGEKVSPEEQQKRKDWRDSMLKKPAPKKGCFSAGYPKTDWQEATCVAAPNIPAYPRHGPRPANVGNSTDVSAHAPTGTITQAIGHFENVTNVTSETGRIGNAGSSIANTYTLQINSDFFSGSTACNSHAGCTAWEQWILWNTGTSAGSASMQYWLIGYGSTCPDATWNTTAILGGSCWKNSVNAVSVTNQPITNMANWRFTGTANGTGDSVTMTDGTTVWTATGTNAVAASTAWTTAEFNIFGYGGDSAGNGDTAVFNNGASANVRTEIIYGGNAAPTCSARGFTAEMNNLNFGPTAPTATAPGPAVIFEESTAGGAANACASASTIGDTHLRTFNNLFYDFQAAGDFTLAQVEHGITVETRQVSGAPTWPNATVNKAVGVLAGKTKVVVCLAPPGSKDPATVFVDGKLTAVEDGKRMEVPEQTTLARQGNVYSIISDGGDSVRAEVNATWINVDVGLGRWPTTVKGLIANANGNVNQIATRDNQVLTNAFNFDELYHRYADSWRVPAEASLLSVCNGEREVERGAPKRAFYAKDLEPAVRDKAQSVCTTAGVKPGPLLEACTLDVAVIGNVAAAKIFVNLQPPAQVGTVTGGEAPNPLMDWWWLWLLILLVLIIVIWMLMRKKP